MLLLHSSEGMFGSTCNGVWATLRSYWQHESCLSYLTCNHQLLLWLIELLGRLLLLLWLETERRYT